MKSPLILMLFAVFLLNCQTNPVQTPQLPVVQIRLSSNRYFLPECEKAAEIPKQVLLELPTVQEAELSGFIPAAGCPKDVIAKRLELERKLYGEMKPTKETEERRAQALIRQKLDDR